MGSVSIIYTYQPTTQRGNKMSKLNHYQAKELTTIAKNVIEAIADRTPRATSQMSFTFELCGAPFSVELGYDGTFTVENPFDDAQDFSSIGELLDAMMAFVNSANEQ